MAGIEHALTGVTFIVPVFNGRAWITDALDAISREVVGLRHEIIVVDDGSTDGSRELLDGIASEKRIVLLDGPRLGAAAAINCGLAAAMHAIVCQVDQDVIVQTGWLTALIETLRNPEVAAAQGVYIAPEQSSVMQRVAALDLRQRYQRVGNQPLDHVCTGNTAYRRDALRSIGGFREGLGYGYDNDASYRLVKAGYRLALCEGARAIHYWPATFRRFLRTQYGLGYGRLDLVRLHPARFRGDRISDWRMMLHAPAALAAVTALALAGVLHALAGPWQVPLLIGLSTTAFLMIDRLIASLRAARDFGDPLAACLFVPVRLSRDLAWACALVVWALRALARRPAVPSHSMSRRFTQGGMRHREVAGARSGA
jgi:GT2 family glycosyltransferase